MEERTKIAAEPLPAQKQEGPLRDGGVSAAEEALFGTFFWHKNTEVPLQRERGPPKCRTHCINKKRGDASDDG